MLQKMSYVTITDGSGAGWIQLFHLYGGSWRESTRPGFFAKGAVKTVAFYPIRIRGKRYRPLRQGFRVRGLLIHTAQILRFLDNTRCAFKLNSAILLKRRGVFKSKYIYGPLPRWIRKKKYQPMFKSFV